MDDDFNHYDEWSEGDVIILPYIHGEVKSAANYGSEMDYWVLENSEAYGMSLFDNLPGEEVDSVINALRHDPVGFRSFEVEQGGVELVSVVDESFDDITVATFGDENGSAYRVRELEVEDVPEEIMDEMPTSFTDKLPFRKQEAYELTLTGLRQHGYNLDDLSSHRIDEAQQAMNEAVKLLESDYDSRAWGYRSKFGI